jgi:hypothetical protein
MSQDGMTGDDCLLDGFLIFTFDVFCLTLLKMVADSIAGDMHVLWQLNQCPSANETSRSCN